MSERVGFGTPYRNNCTSGAIVHRAVVEALEGRKLLSNVPLGMGNSPTEPMVKSSTASASYKPATLENGLVVQVPPFVTEGEEIIVDPAENRYLERAK